MISVITVTYNSSKTIERTILSVISQSYTDIEYIIVDGVSADETVDIIRKYEEQDSRIRFISEPDDGIYDAMNKGIRMAKGDVIALLNSDDYYEPGALDIISKHIPQVEKYVIYGMVRFLENEKEALVALYSHNDLPKRMMMHPACFVSKKVYEEYLYDTRYKSAADFDLFLRLFQDKEVKFIPVYEIITNFRTGGMSSSARGYTEANDIRYKYGYMSKKNKDIANLGVIIKRKLLGK